jgi:hypothetical protein
MIINNGKLYNVEKFSNIDVRWKDIEDAVHRRTKPGTPELRVEEIYDIRWKEKPFPWSFTEFKKERRWFYHGTSIQIINKVLDEGFKVVHNSQSKHGRMLKDGIYATYHTQKGKLYAPDGYVMSVMVYAQNRLTIKKGERIDEQQIISATKAYDAIEVLTGSIISYPNRLHTMQNHEICVYDSRRIIPRFILKIL